MLKGLQAPHVTSARSSLAGLVSTLLDRSASRDEVKHVLQELHDLLYAITGLPGRNKGTPSPRNSAGTRLEDGIALSPFYAAQCLFFSERTVRFMQGLYAALREAQHRFSNEPLQVVYAGTGPYALLALPLMPQFQPGAVQFTLIDIHPDSTTAVRRLLDALDLHTYVRAVVTQDATTYRHPSQLPLHVVVTETMQQALQQEPQVAITRALAPQLCDGGLLVPQRIAVDACLEDMEPSVGPDGNEHYRRTPLGRAVTLTLENSRGTGRVATVSSPEGLPAFPAVVFPLPDLPPQGCRLRYLTTIQVHGDIEMAGETCILTKPYTATHVAPRYSGGYVTLRYVLGSNPRLRHELSCV